MTKRHDLSKLPWQLTGWAPEHWRLGASMELGWKIEPDVSAVAAKVPGSVQQALLNAGCLVDWNAGLQSRQCEWVENRHWLFETTLPADWTRGGGRKLLRCHGLDYRGIILVNSREAGRFIGTFRPHLFDLTDWLTQESNRLTIVFEGVPEYLGQIGYTSRIKAWKPRFNYGWDWNPRLVQIGIWDGIELEIDEGDRIEDLALFTDYDWISQQGRLHVSSQLTIGHATQVEIIIKNETGDILHQLFPVKPELHLELPLSDAQAWHPNGNGPQRLYQVELILRDAANGVLDQQSREIGFRHIQWKPCDHAPPDAMPWICSINGVDTFLQGFNWVPLRPNFADVTEDDYRHRLETYRAMGTNILRVWGGAVLERECFYRLCNRMGILVWQEFPLSSSGIDNWPPEEPAVIADMKAIARSYITRRQHHPSLLLWCGGNELQGALDGSKVGTGKPVDNTHPMMAMLEELVRQLDPTRRFLASSSSGPRFMAARDDFGKGLHHDVHGPWNQAGKLDDWYQYWTLDDALFRSETGMPGASSAEMIQQYGRELAWPANKSNPYWLHCSAWWIQWDDYLAEGGDAKSLSNYVRWSQERQAAALTCAARTCKGRFPSCGGIIIWMGHDSFPCPINTSVIDFAGNRKPAGDALAKVFLTAPVDCRS